MKHLRQILAAQREIMTCGPDLARVMDLVVRRTQDLTGANGAVVELVERVRRAVEAMRVEPVGSVTISGGVATHRSGEPIEDTIARADASLYEAKSQGRNRIVGE